MQNSLKSRQTKSAFEINRNIKEIFSESALASFSDEIDSKHPLIEKIKVSSFY